MRSKHPPVLDQTNAALDALWHALDPDPSSPAPRIRAVMISTIDGTATVDGRSGGLGTPADELVFQAMRARADVILVGSRTALTEGYGAAAISPVWGDRREGSPPTVLLLTRSLSDEVIDHCAAVGPGMGVVAAHGVDADRVRAARDRGVAVHVLDPGPPGAAVRTLMRSLGAGEVDLEGGPEVLGGLLATGGVDELILTLSPTVALGGDATRLVSSGVAGTERVRVRVADAFTAPDGGLYTRWVVREEAQ